MRDKRLYILLFAGILRMGVCGFKYYPLLDDYIQLVVYPLRDNPFFELELFRQRPIAALFDIYVWSRSLNLSFFIITVMHSLSGYFLILVFNRCGIKADLLFGVIFLLCPLNTEATYWLSASGRIVTSVFLASLSAMLLLKKKGYWLLFFVPSLLFYEQTAVFSFLLILMVVLSTKAWERLCSVVSVGLLYCAYYLTFSTGGAFGGRAELGFNVAAVKTFFYMLTLWGGITPTVAALVSPLFIYDNGCPSFKGFLWGVLYFVFGMSVFVILKNPTVSLRCLFVPLIGVALMADSITPRLIRKPIAVLLSVVFICGSVTDIKNYRQNYFYDQRIIDKAVSGDIVFTERNIITGKDFGQFIQSAGSSQWALTGAVRARLKNPYFVLRSH